MAKNRCKKHNRPRPCLLCVRYRGRCGGRAKSEKKHAAILKNLAIAQRRRWRGHWYRLRLAARKAAKAAKNPPTPTQ